MQGRELQNFVMGRRAAEKARAPLATTARKSIEKATAKLVKNHGGDSLMVTAYNSTGEQINGHRASVELQQGRTVTLRMTHCVREPNDDDWTDGGKYAVVGEVTVRL